MSRLVSAKVLCHTEAQAAQAVEVLARALTGISFSTDVYGTVEISNNQEVTP